MERRGGQYSVTNCRNVGAMLDCLCDVSAFNIRRSMIDVSTFEDRCVDFRRSTIDVPEVWRVIKKMYESSKSAVLLEGEKSDTFTIEQGVVAQGCSLYHILFSVFVNDLLKEVEQTGLGIQLSSGKTV